MAYSFHNEYQVLFKSFAMTNEVILLPKDETPVIKKVELDPPVPQRETPVISLPVEKRLPAAVKEFPIHKWTMPPEAHGYIKGNDNDCL